VAGAGSTRVVTVDATVLINLIHVGRLDILGSLRGWEFVVSEQVAEEVSDPEQARMLASALAEGHLRTEPSTEPAEIAAYAELLQVMGKGEAAYLAMAQERGWMVASGKRGCFLRHAPERLAERRILNTPGVLLLAIRQSILSVEEAEQLKADPRAPLLQNDVRIIPRCPRPITRTTMRGDEDLVHAVTRPPLCAEFRPSPPRKNLLPSVRRERPSGSVHLL